MMANHKIPASESGSMTVETFGVGWGAAVSVVCLQKVSEGQ